MNYEQKYKEALERARVYHTGGSICDAHMIEVIFPELKESEGEMIRKDIISYLRNEKIVKRYISDIEVDKWIAWLEKQCEQKTLNADEVIKWLHYHIQVDEPKIEYDEYGQPLAESFLNHAKARCIAADEVVKQFKKDFGL